MVSAQQNLNGSRNLTTPLLGMVCHPRASTSTRPINLSMKVEVSDSTCYENTKCDTKYQKWGALG